VKKAAGLRTLGDMERQRKAEPRRPDRRVRRTCDRLGRALVELIRDKAIGDVTVQEVLNRAKVARSTFYVHYRDKNDLLFSQLEQFLEFISTKQSREQEKSQRVAPVGELSAEDFQVVRKSIEDEICRIEDQIRALDEERSSWEDLKEQSQRDVLDFRESWKAATPARKREIQSALFPEGLVFDPKEGYFEHQNASLTQLVTDIFAMFESVGVPDGI